MSKHALGIGAALALAMGATLGFLLGRQSVAVDPDATAAGGAPSTPASAPPAAGERAVAYWYDPMQPQQRFDHPGKSPFMDMALVPRYVDEAGAAAGVRIDGATVQNLGITTAAVERATLPRVLRLSGVVVADPSGERTISARADGVIERLLVSAHHQQIRPGQLLAVMRSSQWSTASAEFLALRAAGDTQLADAARRRLLALGFPADSIAAVERSGQNSALLEIRSESAGVVAEALVRPGQRVTAGDPLFRTLSLDPIWIELAVPLAQSADVVDGLEVDIELLSGSAERVHGRVDTLLSEVDPGARTRAARIALANPQGHLVPGAPVRGELQLAAQPMNLIPSSALIATGTRNVVIVIEQQRFRAVEVKVGRESDGRTEIVEGLQAGQQVVSSGQFLLDADANLRAAVNRINGASTEPRP